MKAPLVAVAAFAVTGAVCASQAASGANAVVSGTYLVQYTSNCQAILNEVAPAGGKPQINSVSQGHIEEEVGTITFTPNATGVSGKVAINLQTVAGDSVVLQHNGTGGTGVSAAPFATTGTYSYTSTGSTISIVLGPNSQATFQAVLGSVRNGVAQSAVILKQPASGDTCIESAVLMHD